MATSVIASMTPPVMARVATLLPGTHANDGPAM